MSRSTPGEIPLDPASVRASRIKLLIILATFAVPLLLASIWLHMVRTSGGQLGDTSRGELIAPAVPLVPFSAAEADADEAFTEASLQGIWTLIYLPSGECGEVCQRNIYHMRQVRLALNQRMTRVQRVLVRDNPTQLDAALLAEHPGLRVLDGGEALNGQVQEAIANMPPSPDAIYMIDPLGNLMMRFPADLDPGAMLKDIKHLLKVSRIG